MADISRKITRKSIKAKKNAAIKTIKKQAKEKIHEVKIQYAQNPERQKLKEEEREQKKLRREQKAAALLSYYQHQNREYTLGEELFSSISHGIGAGLSVAALVLLIIRAVFHTPADLNRSAVIAGYAIFGASIFITYLMSTLYHAIPAVLARKVFSVLNHDCIYILIAGTYTPFVLTKIPGTLGISLCAVIWGITGFFIVLYSIFGSKLRWFFVVTYMIAGWLIISVFSFVPVGTYLPDMCRALLVSGGVVYTVGGLFYLMRKTKWAHSVFHVLTLCATILHFFCIYFMI